VIADLHLGYSQARRRAGDAVPEISIETQLAPLRQACAAIEIRDVIVAGDLCESRLDADIVGRFRGALDDCRLRLAGVVPGNHDRGWREFADELPLMPDGIELGGWRIVHGDGSLPPGRVVLGHHHPGWRTASRTLPCYVVGPNRLVLPAFSADAAGGDVRSRWPGCRAIVVDGDRLVDRGVLRPAGSRPAFPGRRLR
jgi:metallophosphoesterase superfamily enzyme